VCSALRNRFLDFPAQFIRFCDLQVLKQNPNKEKEQLLVSAAPAVAAMVGREQIHPDTAVAVGICLRFCAPLQERWGLVSKVQLGAPRLARQSETHNLKLNSVRELIQ
jgi:hypothetical protein